MPRSLQFSLGLIMLICATVGLTKTAKPEFQFEHKDWELVCDNTRTCHAIGYHDERGSSAPVSLLLTRAAGPNTQVSAQILAGEAVFSGKAARIESKSLKPAIAIDAFTSSTSYTLPRAVVSRLIASVLKDPSISISAADATVELSLSGATAVLVKMDEVQGRIGTPGALTQRGETPESQVPPPLPPPTLRALKAPATTGADRALVKKVAATIDLQNSGVDCNESSTKTPSIARLSATQLLFTIECGVGAYNNTFANWIVNDREPFAPLSTGAGLFEPRDSSVTEVMKGRGVGDCMFSTTHHFDGKAFVLTNATGDACKGFLGGAWQTRRMVTRITR